MISIRGSIRRAIRGPKDGQHWVRVTMDRAIDDTLRVLQPPTCDAIEVSGTAHASRPWRSYMSVQYPEFDLLAPTSVGEFDVVLCEQVLEHIRDPTLGVAALASLCRPGGHVIITTPFMLRIHPSPEDLWRFTPDGLAHLAANAGLEVAETGSWGNTLCIVANRRRWVVYRPWHRLFRQLTLTNDPLSPQVVWLIARRPLAAALH